MRKAFAEVKLLAISHLIDHPLRRPGGVGGGEKNAAQDEIRSSISVSF